jgi:DNA-binding NarL/FixJ family response regulator
VLVVDDHPLMLAYVSRVLEGEFIVAGTASNVDTVVLGWPSARPDVLVMDVTLGRGSGFDAATRLRSVGCGVPIVFLSVHETPEVVRAAWNAGGLGYVAKRDLGRELVPAIRAALRGERYISAAVVAL